MNDMDDRELMELAALAIGRSLDSDDHESPGYWAEFRGLPQWIEWNPLEDDADCFRMETDLQLAWELIKGVDTVTPYVSAYWNNSKEAPRWNSLATVEGDDVCAARRRASTIVAAKIGKLKRDGQ